MDHMKNSNETARGRQVSGAVAFFEALQEAGITHCFSNLGSDHPGILCAIVEGQRRPNFPKIITCPTEFVALSIADGFARVTGKPQAVIVHVDVGTQALGCAVHNCSVSRVPVLIFAGLSPITQEGELKGSRTEFIHWAQDVHHQRDIVAQYCRYTAEIRTGRNIKQVVQRALSFATSDPKGPVYLCAAREVLEEEVPAYTLDQTLWKPIEPCPMSKDGTLAITDALSRAQRPLLITRWSSRDQRCPQELVKLANNFPGLKVLDAAGSEMCFPADHPGWLGCRYGVHESIEAADVIIVLDCDAPWIPTRCKPRSDAKIYHIDADPLKQQMPLFYINAQYRYRADAYLAISQINEFAKSTARIHAGMASGSNRGVEFQREHQKLMEKIAKDAQPAEDGRFDAAFVTAAIRKACPKDTIYCVQAITNTNPVADQLQLTLPGSWLGAGGGLGWSGGAALGAKLATDHLGHGRFVCQIVGDGSYLFSIPSSVYWIANRYKIPFLTIVLNNDGWNAPRSSLLLVDPDGPASRVSNEDLHISFAPVPDYAMIAQAASGGEVAPYKVSKAPELLAALESAVGRVKQGGSAVIDARII